MKVIFLLDDDSAIAVTPETLQLRQLNEDVLALGIQVSETEFRPFISYPANMTLTVAKTQPVVAPPEPVKKGKVAKKAKKAVV